MRRIHPGEKKKKKKSQKEFRLDSNDCSFICAGVNFAGGYKWHAFFYLSWNNSNKRRRVIYSRQQSCFLPLFEHQRKIAR